LLGSPLIFSK